MTQKIRTQAARFWEVLVSADTIKAYKSAIDTTILILKEGLLLIWLVLCLVLVAFDWGTERAIAAGRSARAWVSGLQKTDSSQIASGAKQKLLSAGKASVSMTIAQARQQLGLPEKEEPSDTVEPEASGPPKPSGVATPTTSAAPMNTPTASVSKQPSTPPSTSSSEDA